jgi:hypothetical protein
VSVRAEKDTAGQAAMTPDAGPATVAGDPSSGDSSSGDSPTGDRPGGWRRRSLWAVTLAVAAVGLFWAYLLQSRSTPASSDGASMALQGWSMLHGNLLLRGWWVADVSFYTFEIPIDAVVEAIRGLGGDVVHITAAVAYTLLVLAAALLARGTARGREGVVRALLTAGILIAPSLSATGLLLWAPDHVGVGVPIMLAFLLVDRARARWWVPVAACVLLLWAQLDDPVAEFAAAAPLALVCLVRAALGLIRDRRGSWWYDAALTLAAAVSYEAAQIAVHLIRNAGGYSMRPLSTAARLMPVSTWGPQLLHTAQNTLLLYGADYWDQPTALMTAFAFLHLVGVALVLCGVVAGIAHLVRRGDRVTQALTVALGFTLGAGAFFTPMQFTAGAHDIAIALSLGAVLGGRAAGPWLSAAWSAGARVRGRGIRRALAPVLGVALLGYLGALGYDASRPSVPATTQGLVAWLARHHLTSGLGPYWSANIATLASGGHVRIAPTGASPAHPYPWITRPSWYDPALHSANFVIAGTSAGGNQVFPVTDVVRAFGKPARVYHYGMYTIMVYDKNLLRMVEKPVQPDPYTGSRLLG